MANLIYLKGTSEISLSLLPAVDSLNCSWSSPRPRWSDVADSWCDVEDPSKEAAVKLNAVFTVDDQVPSFSSPRPKCCDIADPPTVLAKAFSCDLCHQALGFQPLVRCRRGRLCRRTHKMHCDLKCHHFDPCEIGRAAVKLNAVRTVDGQVPSLSSPRPTRYDLADPPKEAAVKLIAVLTVDDQVPSSSSPRPRCCDLADPPTVSAKDLSCDLCHQSFGFQPLMRCRRGFLCSRTNKMHCDLKCHHFNPCENGRAGAKINAVLKARNAVDPGNFH